MRRQPSGGCISCLFAARCLNPEFAQKVHGEQSYSLRKRAEYKRKKEGVYILCHSNIGRFSQNGTVFFKHNPNGNNRNTTDTLTAHTTTRHHPPLLMYFKGVLVNAFLIYLHVLASEITPTHNNTFLMMSQTHSNHSTSF